MTSDRKSSSLATVSSSNPIAGISAANMATSALLEGLSNVSHSWYLLNGVLACNKARVLIELAVGNFSPIPLLEGLALLSFADKSMDSILFRLY